MLRTLVLSAITLSVPIAAAATPITTTFTVLADSGPLAGTSASGSFTFDSSSIVFVGSNFAAGLLTDLTFTWNGIAYNSTTANTGSLEFDAHGTLIGGGVGDTCTGAGCAVSEFTNNWFLSLDTTNPQGFVYATPDSGLFTGHITAFDTPVENCVPVNGLPTCPAQSPVPEPASLLLLGTGLLGGGAARRWRPRRQCR